MPQNYDVCISPLKYLVLKFHRPFKYKDARFLQSFALSMLLNASNLINDDVCFYGFTINIVIFVFIPKSNNFSLFKENIYIWQYCAMLNPDELVTYWDEDILSIVYILSMVCCSKRLYGKLQNNESGWNFISSIFVNSFIFSKPIIKWSILNQAS